MKKGSTASRLYKAFHEKTDSRLIVGESKMKHKIEIDEGQRQLILLALAEICERRPGWEYAANITAMCFPGGADLFNQFRNLEAESVLDALGRIK